MESHILEHEPFNRTLDQGNDPFAWSHNLQFGILGHCIFDNFGNGVFQSWWRISGMLQSIEICLETFGYDTRENGEVFAARSRKAVGEHVDRVQ